MRTRILLGIGLLLIGGAATGQAQDVVWRAANPVSLDAQKAVSLGRPTPLADPGAPVPKPTVVRGQSGIPSPPPYPGSGTPVYPTPSGPAARNIYDPGVVNNDSDLGNFWVRVGDKFKRCWDDVSGGAAGAFQGDKMFRSDTRFPHLASPVSNPFYFIDARALTEIRPLFIWQHTPNSNPVWNGGNNFVFAAAGSVAITPHISLVVNRLGFETISPRGGTPDISSSTGFSEVLLGPKISFGSETSNSVFAFGLTFDIPVGSSRVLQDTGHLMLIPYFSYAQSFGRFYDGQFTFMNTTGYTFRTDTTRTEAFFSSFHLDYNLGGANRVYPLVEMNWRHYMRNGGARALNFEGSDLGNFGSMSVSGRDELTLALGARVRINNFAWWGIAAEFNVLPNGDGRHLDQFRLTTDLIFRY